MAESLTEGIELLIGGSWAPLRKALVESGGEVTAWANKTTDVNRQAGKRAVDIAEETARRKVAIYDRETKSLESELAEQNAKMKAAADKLVEIEAQRSSKAKEKRLEAARAAAAEEARVTEALQKRLTDIQQRGAEARLRVATEEAKRVAAAQAVAAREAEEAKTRQRVQGEKDSVAGRQAMLAGAGAVATGAVAVGLGMGIREAVQAFSAFEAVLQQVRAVSGATDREMQAMTAQALDLGAKTKFSAREAAEGLSELAKSGMSVDQAMAALPGVLGLAAAGGVSVADAAETAAAAINGFGLAAADAGRVADVMAQAANMSAIGVGDLQLTMKYVAPIASAASQSIEEMAAAIAIMGNQGIKGEQAGTTLRGAFSKLIDPSKEAGAVIARLGLHLVDTKGRMLPLVQIVDELRTKTAAMTEMQRNQAITQIFGQEALSGMLALLKQTPEAYEAQRVAMYNAEGAAKSMADVMNQGVNPALEAMKGSIEGLAIVTGEQFAPAIKTAAGYVGSWAEYLSKAEPSTLKWAAALGAAAFAATGLVAAVTAAAVPIAIIGAGLGALGLTAGGVGIALGAVAAAAVVAAGATAAFVVSSRDAEAASKNTAQALMSEQAQVNAMVAEYEKLRDKTDKSNAEKDRQQKLLQDIRKIMPEVVRMTQDGSKAIDLERVALRLSNAERERELGLLRETAREKAKDLFSRSYEMDADISGLRARAATAQAEGNMPEFNRLQQEMRQLSMDSTKLFRQGQQVLRDVYVRTAAPAPTPVAPPRRDDGAAYTAPPPPPSRARRTTGPAGGRWDAAILRASEATGVPPDLIAAVMQQESGGQQYDRRGRVLQSRLADGSPGALGLMQLMPGTAAGLGVNPADPAQNLLGGARYLAQQLRTFGGDEKLAVAAYNAGPGAVQGYERGRKVRGIGVPPYPETRNYVTRVAALRQQYSGIGGARGQALSAQARATQDLDQQSVADLERALADARKGAADTRPSGGYKAFGPSLSELMAANKDAPTGPMSEADQEDRYKAAIAGRTTAMRDAIVANSNYTKSTAEVSQVNEAARAGMGALLGGLAELATAPSWQTLGSVVSRTLGNPQAFTAVQQALGGIGKAFDIGKGSAQGLEGAVSGVGGVMATLAGRIDPLSLGLSAIAALGPVIADSFDEAINGPKGVRAAFKGWGDDVAAIQTQLDLGLLTPLQAISEEASAAQNAMAGFVSEYTKLGGAAGEAKDQARLAEIANQLRYATLGLRGYLELEKSGIDTRVRNRSMALAGVRASKGQADALALQERVNGPLTANPMTEIQEGLANDEARIARDADVLGLSELEVADKRAGLLLDTIAKLDDAIAEVGAGTMDASEMEAWRDHLLVAAKAGQTVADAAKKAGDATADQEDKYAHLNEYQKAMATLTGTELTARIQILKNLDKAEGSAARRLAAEERLAALTSLQAQAVTAQNQIAEASKQRLEAEREIAALMRQQADEAERIRGESIAVRQLTEAQDKAKRLAELEARTAEQLASLRTKYEEARASEVSGWTNFYGVQGNLQGMKGDAGSGPDFGGALQAALASIMASAPRFHSGGRVGGMAGAEVPAVLKVGEWVFTPQQLQRMIGAAYSMSPLAMPNAVGASRGGNTVNNKGGDAYVTIQMTGTAATPAEVERSLDRLLSRYGFSRR